MLFVSLFLLLFLVLWLLFYAVGPLLSALLTKTAHFTTKLRYHDYLPVFVVLAIGIGLTAVAGDAFLDLAERVHAEAPQLQHVDYEVHEWARTTRTNGSTFFFTTMTILGLPVTLGLLSLAVAALLFARGRWKRASYLLVTISVGGLLNLELKRYFARARPDLAEALRRAHGYSFPSGHAMGSTIVIGAFAYLAFRALHSTRTRAAALALAVTIVAAIATSRIYLGVHWISDVAAGIAAGSIWVTTSTVAYETFRRIGKVRGMRAAHDEKQDAAG
ncbi:MAG TPA: phosphatase PAP2 family protein [Thermoanaerobaculia bacterium]